LICVSPIIVGIKSGHGLAIRTHFINSLSAAQVSE
jgi:hypothetical protein